MSLLLASLIAGCASVPPAPPASYDTLVERAADGEPIDPLTMRRAFLESADFDARLRQLLRLERQLLDAPDEVPLRLGATGSAALDQYYGSLAAHQVLASFYRHLELPEQAALHDAWAKAIQDAIESSAEGTVEAPYSALSAHDAEAFLTARGLTVVGAKYHETEDHPLLLWVTARPEDGPMQNLFFDIHDLYAAIEVRVEEAAPVVFPVGPADVCETTKMCQAFNVWAYLHILARSNDSAAQTFIGWKLATWGQLDESAGWLMQAAQSHNGFANLTLADLSLVQSRRTTGVEKRVWLERAERRLMLAIAAGYETAMFTLGNLYLDGEFGKERKAAGPPLLKRAAELDNIEAQVRLGWHHALGETRNHELAEQFFLRAADNSEFGKLHYARFLIHPEVDREFNDRAYRWLRDIAKNDNPDAMLLIAQMYAKGVRVNKSPRRARSWFKNAVKVAPDDAGLVNEVAWTLTVSPTAALRDERYALKIMDRVMADENNAARRNPAYLDTWAATYAANGDFERAISVQEEAIAIERAKSNDQSDDVEVLEEHLKAFRAGKRISEDVP